MIDSMRFYLIADAKPRRHQERDFSRPKNWAGLHLANMVEPGETVVAVYDLQRHGCDWYGRQLQKIETVAGWREDGFLTGPVEMDRMLSHLAQAHSSTAFPVVLTGDKADASTVGVRHMLIGGVWMPYERQRQLLWDHRAKVYQFLVDKGWPSDSMKLLEVADGNHSITAYVWRQDGSRHIVEMGDSVDGPYASVRPLADHNRMVNEMNEAM